MLYYRRALNALISIFPVFFTKVHTRASNIFATFGANILTCADKRTKDKMKTI